MKQSSEQELKEKALGWSVPKLICHWELENPNPRLHTLVPGPEMLLIPQVIISKPLDPPTLVLVFKRSQCWDFLAV